MLMAVFQTNHGSWFPLFLPQTVLEETLWDNWHRYTYTDRMSFPLPNSVKHSRKTQSTEPSHQKSRTCVILLDSPPNTGGMWHGSFYDGSPMPLKGK